MFSSINSKKIFKHFNSNSSIWERYMNHFGYDIDDVANRFLYWLSRDYNQYWVEKMQMSFNKYLYRAHRQFRLHSYHKMKDNIRFQHEQMGIEDEKVLQHQMNCYTADDWFRGIESGEEIYLRREDERLKSARLDVIRSKLSGATAKHFDAMRRGERVPNPTRILNNIKKEVSC